MINMTKDILNGKDATKRRNSTIRRNCRSLRNIARIGSISTNTNTEVVLRVREHVERASEGCVSGFDVEQEVREERVPERFDPESTAYNKAYLIKILDKAEDEIKDYESRNAF